MRRHSKILTAFLILILVMTSGFVGCGQKEVIPVTEPTVEVTKDGELIAYLVESFDKEYYSLAELEAMVKDEVADYVAEGGFVTENGHEGMTVESVAMAADGSRQVVVALKFANDEIYADYFQTEIFYGTVAEAVAEGYGLSAALTSVEDGELFTNEMIDKNKKSKILIIDDSVVVRCPKKVLYVGNNASLTEEGFVDCTQDEGLKLMIMK